jgi:hypothetical protein
MLREHSIYFKFSTEHCLLGDATFLEILDQLETWASAPFETVQDLLNHGRPRPWGGEQAVAHLHSRVGAGVNQQARLLWKGAEGRAVRSVELNAGSHPYAGRFQTLLDIRLDRGWFERQGELGPRMAERRFVEIARLIHPFQGHAHDTDDNAVQNTDNAGLLERGFGVKVEGPIDLAANPGRELSRGPHRYAVNWLTLFGPELVEKLGRDLLQAAPAPVVRALEIDPKSRKLPAESVAERLGEAVEKEGEWWMLRLSESPLDFPDNPAAREVQRAVREHLGLRDLARQERWELGYWQKKE